MKINDTLKYLNVGLPEDILRRKLYGDFDGAARLIDRKLNDEGTPDELRWCLTAQKEMMRRTPADFPYTRADALALVRKHIPDFTEDEFNTYLDEGRIRWIYLNGEERFFNRFFDSMCKAMPAFAKRAGVTTYGVEATVASGGKEHKLDRVMRIMREKGSISNRIKIHAEVKLKDEFFTPGMFIRAHLPIPSACDQQSDIKIEAMYPETGMIAPEDAAQRTICWEENMEENHVFWVEYSYVHQATYHDVSKITADPVQPAFDTQEEAPHIVFTPYIKAIVAKLSEGTDDPLEKARRFYDFVTLNCKYTFMPAYFILENIAETSARSFTGDCGVFALLLITMLRCAGIPAQWQSGLTAEPDFCGGHDWVRFYIAPYGWLFADPSYGTGAVRENNEERRKFYFGNLDAYRMVANSAFQTGFTVDKEQWRADPYDNQVGEMESADRGYSLQEFDRAKYIMSHEEI